MVLGEALSQPLRAIVSLRPCRAACLLVLALLCAACPEQSSTLPAELMGRWVTQDSRFEGRAMQFEAGQLSFETGSEPRTIHRISAVEPGDGPGTLTVIYLGGEEMEYRLDLHLDSQAGVLSLANRPDVIWRKADS